MLYNLKKKVLLVVKKLNNPTILLKNVNETDIKSVSTKHRSIVGFF